MAGLDANTKLLTHFNGMTGGLEVKDSAPVPHIFTENGTAALQTDITVRRFGKGSLLLDGNSDYISIPDHNDWDINNNTNYTVEFWWYPETTGTTQYIVDQGPNTNNEWSIYYVNTGAIGAQSLSGGGLQWNPQSAAGVVSVGTWHHIALIKVGGDIGLYVNGKQVADANMTLTTTFAAPLRIGVRNDSNWWTKGNIDEFRIRNDNVHGAAPSAGLTDTFDVPDAPYTSDINTLLLLHMDTLVDSGNTDHTANITYVGTAQHTAPCVFGKGAFDFPAAGSNYITYADHADWDLALNADFTLEFWFANHLTTGAFIMGNITGATGWAIRANSGGGWVWDWYGNGSIQETSAAFNPGVNVWHHICVQRSSNNVKWFFNGVASDAGTAYGNAISSTAALYFGRDASTADYINAKIDDLRFVNGTAVYNHSGFTPPTAPLTAIANTKLLLSGDVNATDASTSAHEPSVPTAGPTCTAISRFGNSSLYLDGNSDVITAPASDRFNMVGNTTDSWTVDFWVRMTDHAGDEYFFTYYENTNNYYGLRHLSGNGFLFEAISGAVTIISTFWGGEIYDSMWHHVAVVKVVDDYGIYLDGVQVNFINDASIDNYSGTFYIGNRGAEAFWYDGLIDEFRLQHNNTFSAAPVVGLTDTITVPTDIHTEDGSTNILLHLESYDVSNDGGRNCERTHVPEMFITAQTDAGPVRRFGQGCLQLDGDSDSVNISASTDFDIVKAAGSSTIECWAKFVDHVGDEAVFAYRNSDSNFYELRHIHGTGSRFLAQIGGSIVIDFTGREITDTDWHHFAIIRVADDWQMYIDGIATANAQNENHTATYNGTFYIGQFAGARYFNGYEDEFRIVLHASDTSAGNPYGAVPTSSTDTITVPTAPHTSDTNTKLLLHFNDMLDDGNTGHITTYVGTAQHTGISRFDDGGMYFNGGSQYVHYADDAAWDVGTSDWTVDFWTKIDTIGSNACWIDIGGYQNGIMIAYTGTQFYCYIKNTYYQVLWSPKYDTWYHIALVRTGNALRFFVNGVKTGADGDVTGKDITGLTVGTRLGYETRSVFPATMTIDEVRFSDTARWTATFTPPTAAYADDANTLFLVHMDYNADDSSSNSIAVSTISGATNTGWKRFGTGSLLLDGNSDYVRINDTTPDFDIAKSAAENWTVDFWLKPLVSFDNKVFISHYEDGSNHWAIDNRNSGGTRLRFYVYTGASIVVNCEAAGGTGVQLGIWQHIAMCKVGSLYGLYLNGAQVAYTNDTSTDVFAGGLFIGSLGLGSYTQGYMDEVRIQYGNYFSAAPVVGLTDTITVPTEEYSPAAPAPTVPVTGNQAVMFG